MAVFDAVTVWQPWATLIAYEAKLYEFRGRPPPNRLIDRHIAIHAAARKPNLVEIRALLVKLHSSRWRETGLVRSKAIGLLEALKGDFESLPRCGIVCLARIGAPMPPKAVAERIGTDPALPGNWAWPLHDVVRLEPPVPAAGQQGWWKVTIPEEVFAHV